MRRPARRGSERSAERLERGRREPGEIHVAALAPADLELIGRRRARAGFPACSVKSNVCDGRLFKLPLISVDRGRIVGLLSARFPVRLYPPAGSHSV